MKQLLLPPAHLLVQTNPAQNLVDLEFGSVTDGSQVPGGRQSPFLGFSFLVVLTLHGNGEFCIR
jgi:hypothetical protein